MTATQELTEAATDGATRITLERFRQILRERYTHEHDDAHTSGALAQAASCYAHIAYRLTKESFEDIKDDYIDGFTDSPIFPWDIEDWKPSPDPIRNLEKAGALIAAEIDRLLRKRERDNTAAENALLDQQKQSEKGCPLDEAREHLSHVAVPGLPMNDGRCPQCGAIVGRDETTGKLFCTNVGRPDKDSWRVGPDGCHWQEARD